MLKAINGTAVMFWDGSFIAVEFQESLPYASLNCFMADECKDYEHIVEADAKLIKGEWE